MLPSGEAAWSKRDAQRAAGEACAAEIVRLLRGAREGAVTVGDVPLAPADIAVLVRTHRQGSLVKRVLAAWGVGSVELAHASVFATLDAEQLERMLAAIDTPGDLRRLRAALAADWFGLDAAALLRLAQLADSPLRTETDAAQSEVTSFGAAGGLFDDDATAWVERFSRYRTLWHERGFAMMWRTLMRELGIGRRLIAGVEGERRLTDVNHLAELVAARAAQYPGIVPTLRWLAAQRVQGGGEEAQLRLESDRDLVQIVTVHKSKGLEYAVVFCPFLNDGSRLAAPGSNLPDAREYHEKSGSASVAVLHYGCEGEHAERAEREAVREEAAERARLVYVALTRAVYRCYVVAGTYQSSRSTKESRRSVLNWLVAGDARAFDDWSADPPDEAALAGRWQALAGGSIALEALPVPERCEPLPREAASGQRFFARSSRRKLTETWRIASFSSLASAAHRRAAHALDDEPRPDHDALAAAEADAQATVEAAGRMASELPAPFAAASSDDTPRLTHPHGQEVVSGDDILAFPRGAAAGECLHRLFELADFTAPATWPQAIERALIERPVSADAQTAARMPAMMASLIADVVGTELAPGLTLAALSSERRFNEWPFLFASPSLDPAALRRLLAAHGYADVALDPGMLSGFVKGFIDMILEHEGRYWIVDWKSNHLGMNVADYGAASVDAAMAHHAYHLQALLYTVALDRYLKTRKARYDYDAHMGGYIYVFLRGVRPAWRDGSEPAGVHVRKPARALVEALDALMGGGGQA
jgi:exodeoxyribonuclease V beta subunit